MTDKYIRHINGYRVWTDNCTLIASLNPNECPGAWGEVKETGEVLHSAPFRYPNTLTYLEPPELDVLVNITQIDRKAFLEMLALSIELTQKNEADTELYDRHLFGDVGLEGYYSAFVPSRVLRILQAAEDQGFDIDTTEVVTAPGAYIADGSITHSPAYLRFSGLGFVGVLGVAEIKMKKAKIYKLF